MATYRSMLELKIPSRRAASLTGVSRTTANRKPAPLRDQLAVVPTNKFSAAERAEILAALNSPEFVDLAPMQVYTKLLDQGIYLGSLSTFYRVLEENNQVKERRRLAKHPPRAVPELVATAPGQVFTCYADVVIMPMLVCDPTFRAVDGKKGRHNHALVIGLSSQLLRRRGAHDGINKASGPNTDPRPTERTCSGFRGRTVKAGIHPGIESEPVPSAGTSEPLA